MYPYGAFLTGLGAGTVYVVVRQVVLKARVDDPVDSVAGKTDFNSDQYCR
jgi:hypothetical protein